MKKLFIAVLAGLALAAGTIAGVRSYEQDMDRAAQLKVDARRSMDEYRLQRASGIFPELDHRK